MDASRQTDLSRRVNDRYWSSDASVNQVAEELALSKSALYGLIEPMPSGLACPGCEKEAGYANRTARDRGRLSCEACGWEGEREGLEDVGARFSPHGDPLAEPADRTTRGGASAPSSGSAPAAPPLADQARPGLADQVSPGLRRIVVGSALVGAAAGLLLVMGRLGRGRS